MELHLAIKGNEIPTQAMVCINHEDNVLSEET